MKLNLKVGLLFARFGKIGSVIGIVLTSISLILIKLLEQDPTMALVAMAFYLINFYAYTSLIEYVQDRIKEEEKKK